MKTLLIIAGLLWLLAKAIKYVTLFFEREHVRGDLEPRVYNPKAWVCSYMEGKVADANALNLTNCGSYFTAKHASTVKGPMLLYHTPDGQTIAALISARYGMLSLKKVELITRFTDGTSIVTTDNVPTPDITGGIEKKTVYEASLDELLRVHEARLRATEKVPQHVLPSSAFSIYESLEYERGERMVRQGYARWADPARTSFRLTVKGVREVGRASSSQSKRVISDVMEKRRK